MVLMMFFVMFLMMLVVLFMMAVIVEIITVFVLYSCMCADCAAARGKSTYDKCHQHCHNNSGT